MSSPTSLYGTEPVGATSGLVTLLDTTDYREARRVVDELSDRGFDVSQTAIVWRGLRRVERVTGRRTVLTAALQGALAGAWFGGFIGLLLILWVDFEDGTESLLTFLSYVLVGALVGAIWFGGAHWMTRGKRDFSTLDLLEAEQYSVLVAPDRREEAQRLTGLTQTRPMDPQPGEPRPAPFPPPH